MLIVFIGPDGCGKTTIATKVGQRLSASKIEVNFFELNFGILPRFRDIVSFIIRRRVGHRHVEGEYLGGMKHTPNGRVKAGIYVLWYGLDYLLGRLRYRTALKHNAVLFARYVHDYGYQRSYALVPKSLLKLAIWLAPTPDFVFTISRNSERIFQGKPELAVEEINRQQQKITLMLREKPYFYILDGEQGVEDTVAQVMNIIERQVRR